MMNTTEDAMLLNRQEFQFIVNAAMDSRSYRFGRQAVSDWLRVYPGDLGMTLLLARLYMAEGNKPEALTLLEKVCRKDPEYRAAQENLAILIYKDGVQQGANALGSAFVLGRKVKSSISLPEWSQPLQSAFTAFHENRLNEAEKLVHKVIEMAPDIELAAILHLKISGVKNDKEGVAQLAELYHTRWPDCLQFSLCLADSKMDDGRESDAVSLLHQCVANDAVGQVPNRLWGTNFRYLPLWLDKLEIEFELPIPAEVAAVLGWNKLPQGELVPTIEETDLSETGVGGQQQTDGDIPAPMGPPQGFEAIPAAVTQSMAETVVGPSPQATNPGTPVVPIAQKPDETPKDSGNLQSVTSAFANLATRLNKPAIAHSDGRFPVYLILSTRGGLEKQYGQQTMTVIDEEIKKLGDTISRRVGMRGLVFYPDDPEITNTLGVTKIDSVDPVKIKNAVSEVDRLLSRKGEMIGALLIVGGPDVVPFHELPNPTEDVDKNVASDNPYGVMDANYFIPEWPVGRIPGEQGQDAGLLLEQIRNIRNHHGLFAAKKSINVTQVFSGIYDLFQKLFGNQANINTGELTTTTTTPSSSLGITASVWRRSSLSVFKPIGDPGELLISPPETSGSINSDKLSSSQIGYFNLHGLTDSPNWYGQRESTDTTSTEYPVAISPKDLEKSDSGPQVVYCESCYGAYIFNKSEDESMALKFLSLGAKAFVGSTTIAYGSVNTPLIGADLLGFLFWKLLREGFTAGEALMQAKVEMVRELNKRQGFLDGDDQKTLISFVLYGDPLGGSLEKPTKAKKIFRLVPQPLAKTFDDEKDNVDMRVVSEQELAEVRQIVASYLPDLENADLVVNKQRIVQAADSRTAMNHLERKELGQDALKHVVITITKKVQTSTHLHHHYARATMDPQGKLVKLAISR